MFALALVESALQMRLRITKTILGDEITSAACDQNCIEEWKLRRTYICELAMNDLHYELVPDSCAI